MEPAFSRSRVDRSARILVDSDASDDQFADALRVFSNWRAAHGYPLNTAQVVLRARARRVCSTALISQRHKREISIIRKIERSNSMRLTQMQDIAGCRAIVNTMRQLSALEHIYSDDVRDDYVKCPPASGYRSVHAVSLYEGKKKTAFDGLLVETQLRTALQHAWATAVETVDTFTGSDLKSGFGEDQWRRLFSLVSTSFCSRERSPSVPGTPASSELVRRELRELESELGLTQRLMAWHRASQFVRAPEFRFKKHLLIELWPITGVVKLHTFSADQFGSAAQKYSELEQQVTAENRLQVVMASADSLQALKRAYPNLFVDPTAFLVAYAQALSD